MRLVKLVRMRSNHKFKGESQLMARKATDKDIVPQNLATLKRPALQKLCKQLGLKANGKNTEMVRSLEEYREKLSLEPPNRAQDPSSCSLEQLPVVCVERDGDEKCGEGEGSEDVTSCDVGKCEEGRSEGVKVETLEGGEKEGEGVTEGTVGGRGKGRGKGGRQKRHRAMRGRGRGQTSVEEDTPKSEPQPPEGTEETSSPGEQHATQSSISSPDTPLEDMAVSPDTGMSGPDKENLPVSSCPTELDENTMEVEDTKFEKSPESLKRSSGHRKRRRNTHSVSPMTSSTHTVSPAVSSSVSEPQTEGLPNAKRPRPDSALVENCGDFTASDTETVSCVEGTHLKPEGLSPPTAGGEDCHPRRQRRNTYSVSPQSTFVSASDDVALPPISPPTSTDIVDTTPPSGLSRKRKRTHSISPRSSLLLSGGISMDTDVIATVSKTTEETTTNTEEIPHTAEATSDVGSTTDEIMALLDQRVADRKAAPSYVPPPSLLTGDSTLTGSRIPVSKTVAKMNRAHDKHFSKMASIVEFSEKKKKRAQAFQNSSTPGPPAKKQKVVSKTPATLNKPSIKKSTLTKSHTPASKGGPTIVRPVIPKSNSATTTRPNVTNAVHCEPNLTTQDANFNFGKTVNVPATKTSTAKSAIKTTKPTIQGESRPFKFSAQPVSSPSSDHPKHQSKDHGSQFKPHKGKLPNFAFSIY